LRPHLHQSGHELGLTGNEFTADLGLICLGIWIFGLGLLVCVGFALAQQPEACCTVVVQVQTETGQPIGGAAVRLESGAIRVEAATGARGEARVDLRTPGRYWARITAPGFFPAEGHFEIARDQLLELAFILGRSVANRQEITVRERLSELDPKELPSSTSRDQLRSLPERLADLRSALPVLPGVVRTPEGRLQISGEPEYRSTMLVNSVDVTDPATGSFGATVPVDVVETLQIYKSPFLAEYGRFSTSVVEVVTRRGGERWHSEVNDPFPEFRIRSGRLHGIRGFTPRLAATGPVVRNRLFFAGAGSFELRKRPIYPLPFPYNEEKTQRVNAYGQLDYLLPRQMLTLSLHAVPQRANFAGLNFYTPQPAAPATRSREMRFSATHKCELELGLLASAFSAAETQHRTYGQGTETLELRPNTTAGNYFFSLERTARRYQWVQNFEFRPTQFHQWKIGSLASTSNLRGWTRGVPVQIASLNGAVLEVLPIEGGSTYALRDWEGGFYAQDGWQPLPSVRVDLGLRADGQRISRSLRFAPRVGFAWAPTAHGTVLRGGFGWFFDRVPLTIYAFPFFPQRGMENRLGGGSASALTVGSGFAPRSATWSVAADQTIGKSLRLRTAWFETRSQGLIVARLGQGLQLTGLGAARTRQLELLAKWNPREEQVWNFSYVHTAGRGHLNEFSQFAGDIIAPVVRADVYATLPGVIPHRLLGWGTLPMRYGLRLAPMVEWRNGFPYSPLNERQQYAGEPNSLRLPTFFSLDVRVSKDIPWRGHKVRVSFSLFNATHHGNFDAVRLNIADPQFGEVLGRRPRRYRLDFDWLF
jgi:hypothetical protein